MIIFWRIALALVFLSFVGGRWAVIHSLGNAEARAADESCHVCEVTGEQEEEHRSSGARGELKAELFLGAWEIADVGLLTREFRYPIERKGEFPRRSQEPPVPVPRLG